MAKIILYLLESSMLLAFLYSLYLLILRKETFFELNRFFLLSSVVVSFMFPLISLEFVSSNITAVNRPIEEISKFRMSYYETMALWDFESSNSERLARTPELESQPLTFNIDRIKILISFLLIIYAAGVVVCLTRTVWSIRWLWKMISMSPKTKRHGITIIKINQPIAPFSFFQYAFVHEAVVDTPEFDPILAHEKTHIEQRHSTDLVFVQILAAFIWFNPVIWRLMKSLKTTHEYIADKKIINSGYSLAEYQTLLLKQLISNNSFGLVHNFNLSFIKKRITMIKNKRSGWSGKVKVAMTIAGSLICSAVIIQCNSKLDDGSMNSENQLSNEFASSINLPVLPKTGYVFDGNPDDALTFTISRDKLAIDGEPYSLNEIVSKIQKGIPSIKGHIVMHIDKDQSMGFVREVEMELRKADRRKILYVGRTEDGIEVETPILLPPTAESSAKTGFPEQPDIRSVEADGKTDIFKINAGENAGVVNQKKVYDFVKSHMLKQSTEYVVSLRYDEGDRYDIYLANLIYVKEGFNQLYQERAHEMFGKDYYHITKEEYNAVRKNVPMAISIAEAY
jgi:hypothetical protein